MKNIFSNNKSFVKFISLSISVGWKWNILNKKFKKQSFMEIQGTVIIKCTLNKENVEGIYTIGVIHIFCILM